MRQERLETIRVQIVRAEHGGFGVPTSMVRELYDHTIALEKTIERLEMEKRSAWNIYSEIHKKYEELMKKELARAK